MREIEFRGYDPDTERWYYGSYVRLERTTRYPISPDPEGDEKKFQAEQVDHYIFFTESSDWGLPTRKLRATVDPASVGQYTGIRDKSKHKIYEGDILRTDMGDFVVYWRNECSGWYIKKPDGHIEFLAPWLGNSHHDQEVIGNTYKKKTP